MMKKIISLLMALCLCLCMGVSAFAAEIGETGGAGETPVTLTTTNDGIGGAPGASATRMSVTVPTTLPLAMSDDGTVMTATDCRIINHSYGAVRVKNVSISTANGWFLTSYGNSSSLASEKVDSNKLGFALRIGDGEQVKTSGNAAAQTLLDRPIPGCYMTGAGNSALSKAEVSYDAIVTPLSKPVYNATVASTVFVVEWDTV